LITHSPVYGYNSDNYSEIGLPVSKIFPAKQHLGGSQLWSIHHNKSGFIYAGTNQGLAEWDGEKWHSYRTPNNTPIKAISQWLDNRIYVGTTNDIGYFESDKKGILQYHSLLTIKAKIPQHLGEALASASNQYGVIFVTEYALIFWDGKKLHSLMVSKTNLNIKAILATETGFIYKRKNQSNLTEVLLSKNKDELNIAVNVSKLDLPNSVLVTQLIKSKNNRLIAITHGHGVFQENNGKMIQQLTRATFGRDVWLEKAIQASDGYYYLTSTYHGLFILNANIEIVRQYTAQHNIQSKRLSDVIEDFQGNIWLSGTPNIVKFAPPHRYSQYQTSSNSNNSEYIALLNERVTVAGDGLLQLSKANDPFAPATFKNIKSNNKSNWHFIQYKGHTVYSENDGIYALNNKNSKATAQTILKAVSARMLAIEPKTNTLFALTYEGLFRLNFEGNRWFAKLISNTVAEFESLVIDKNSIIWAGTTSGEVYRIENAEDNDKKVHVSKFDQLHGLPNGSITPLNLFDKTIFVTPQGLLEFQEDRVPQFDLVSNSPDIFKQSGNSIYHLYQDAFDRVWYQINDKTGVLIQNKNKDKEWLSTDHIFTVFPQIKNRGFIVTQPDTLWFTQENGKIYRANIPQLQQLPKKAKLSIRQITNLANGSVYLSGNKNKNQPVFDQDNNSIRIHFSLTDHSNQRATLYRAKLLNDDDSNQKWSQWSTENHKDYTSLRGNNYTFVIEAKDNWQRISQQSITFEVLPAWYLNSWAWFFYIIIIVSLLVLSGWATQKWRTQKLLADNAHLASLVDERTQEVQAQAEELKQQQVLKDRFFANVSHEFRTPLTLTITPLKDLLHEQPDLDSNIAYPVETALRNSNKMLDLVSQILDINRLESGQFPLRIAQYDIADLVRQIQPRFLPWAEQHQQKLSLVNIDEPLMLYFDQDQIDKCLSNLISNAIKYSGDNCTIAISIINSSASHEDHIGIAVTDNGRGINLEARDKIFDRYYQDKHSEQITEPGTGIGLALVKELIELHKGTVELSPQTNAGCQFILWLKRGKSHFNSDNFIESVSTAVATAETSQQTLNAAITSIVPRSQDTNNNIDSDDDITTLLVVDDNSELRYFISHKLSSYYRIIQATNGKEGLALAQSELPDLIISDVMMPIMNGFDMCAAIKSNEHTCTIPLILLTAKSSKRETVEGLQTGADDYLTKPFDTSELIARVAGLINNRKILRKSLLKQYQKPTSPLQQQETFEHKLMTIVANNLSEPSFNIDKLASELATSRSSLNRKCQQAHQLSAGHYIHQQRMVLALSLIKEQRYSVSEVAYATGFESLAYFSRSFKKHFGESPSTV